MTQRYAHLCPDVFAEDYDRLADLLPRPAAPDAAGAEQSRVRRTELLLVRSNSVR